MVMLPFAIFIYLFLNKPFLNVLLGCFENVLYCDSRCVSAVCACSPVELCYKQNKYKLSSDELYLSHTQLYRV